MKISHYCQNFKNNQNWEYSSRTSVTQIFEIVCVLHDKIGSAYFFNPGFILHCSVDSRVF